VPLGGGNKSGRVGVQDRKMESRTIKKNSHRKHSKLIHKVDMVVTIFIPM
jgi:hypothetical protein